ncbi:MAG: tetratricopeptide repeat protein [Proteobacteria bacterium]|nr:tetratricopeptide repeat protein [Pseudomonadota bacterium]
MSFFEKLLGGTFESNRDRGEKLFAKGDYGEARLAFDRALSKAKGVPADQVQAVRERSHTCKLELARARIDEADRYAGQGDFELAIESLGHAAEISEEAEIIAAVEERQQSYEAQDARSLVEDGREITEEELLSVIAGTWIEPQAEEYAAMPDELSKALLLAHDGDHQQAAERIEELTNRADLPILPRYLFFELGREKLLTGQDGEAIRVLDAFLIKTDGDPAALGLQIKALYLKAQALSNEERLDEAEEQLIRATDLAPEDYTAVLMLGKFLRSRKDYPTAINALNRAVELMGQMQPDFSVIRELGFTYLAMGDAEEAKRNLGAVIEHQASKGQHDQFDPETAVSLAELHEADGELIQAADLYRHLALGHDTMNHFTYNVEAARLLTAAGADGEIIERHRVRATELASSDEQLARVAKVR